MPNETGPGSQSERERVSAATIQVLEKMEEELVERVKSPPEPYTRVMGAWVVPDSRWPSSTSIRGMAQEFASELLEDPRERDLLAINLCYSIEEAFFTVRHEGLDGAENADEINAEVDQMVHSDEGDEVDTEEFVEYIDGLPDHVILATIRETRKAYDVEPMRFHIF